MIALLLRTGAFLTLFFTFLTVLIHLQPYDDAGLGTFLTSPGCSMPCFLGIRPGVTTCDEAAAILVSHQWVGEMTLHDCASDLSSGYIVWKWSGQQPSRLRHDSIRSPSIRLVDGIVQEILFDTNIPLGEIWLLYGAPQHGFMDVMSGAGGFGYIAVILNGSTYPERGLGIISYAPCPTTFEAFWNAPTLLSFTSNPQSSAQSMEQFAYLLKHYNAQCRN